MLDRLLALQMRRILLEGLLLRMEGPKVFLALSPYALSRGMVPREVPAERSAVVVECCDRWRTASCRIEAGRDSIKTFELLADSGQRAIVVKLPLLARGRSVRATELHARLPGVPVAYLIVKFGFILKVRDSFRCRSVLFGDLHLGLGQVVPVACIHMRDLDEIPIDL